MSRSAGQGRAGRMEARFFRGLSTAVLGVLSTAFVAGMVLPVYSDEIGWRFQERAGFDGVDKMFSEACGPNTLAVPPWFMMPVRWYSAIFNGAFADPFWIRVSGVIYALVWVAMAVLLVRRLAADPENRAIITTAGIGLLALGTMPLLMVWSRPEQPIALAAVGVLVIAFSDGARQPWPSSTSRQAWFRSLAIWALGCVAISYHVKGLFLFPLILACLFFASRGSKAHVARITAAFLVLVTTVSGMSYWRGRLACPDDPILLKAYNENNLSGAISQISSLAEARSVLGKMLENVSIFQYMTDVGPQIDPLSFWLEYGQISDEASFHWFVAIAFAWAMVLIPAGLTAAFALVRGFRQRRLNPNAFLAFVTFGVALAWSSMQPIRNVYESKFVLPLLILAIVLGLSARSSDRLKPGLHIVTAIVGLFAIVSPFAIGAIYAASFERAARQTGYLAAQQYSVSVFGYSELKPDIEAAAKLCGIDTVNSRAVMVDDLTYFTFIHSKLPQHKFGVLGGWNGEIDDPVAYLTSRRSAGAVLGCHYLGGDLRKRAKQVGKFCCLAPPNW